MAFGSFALFALAAAALVGAVFAAPTTTGAAAASTAAGSATTNGNIDATEFCFACRHRVNTRGLYDNPDDCHTFFQCFYLSDSTAIGFLRSCPAGTFFSTTFLQCLPEGPIPCQDVCQNDTIAARGCYANPGNCADFFVCSNEISYGFCCPVGTTIDPNTCICKADENCTDTCTFSAAAATTTPVSANATTVAAPNFCQDANNNTLQPVTGEPSKFQVVNNGSVVAVLDCAPGTEFNSANCICDVTTNSSSSGSNATSSTTSCLLWLPFNSNAADQSSNHLTTFIIGGAFVDNSTDATGEANSGSFSVNGGSLEIPGLMGIDLGSAASWCLFFKCNDTTCQAAQGGLLSNSIESLSVIMAVQASKVVYALGMHLPISTVNVSAALSASSAGTATGFHQMCVVFNGTQLTLYVDNVVVNTQSTAGEVDISQCPYTVGDDPIYGNFAGNIDDVLICKHALTTQEVAAHYSGDFAYLASVGDIPAASV